MVRDKIPRYRPQISACHFHHLVKISWWFWDFLLINLQVAMCLYSVFPFEPLQNLNCCDSKWLIDCMIQYLLSSEQITHPDVSGRKMCFFRSVRRTILRRLSSWLSVFQDSYAVPRLDGNVLQKEWSSRLNGLFLSTVLRSMLKEKDSHILDMIFLFFCGCVDLWTRYDDETLLKNIHTKYSQFIDFS